MYNRTIPTDRVARRTHGHSQLCTDQTTLGAFVDVRVVGTSLRKASLGSNLGNYSSHHLRDVLSVAYRRLCMYDRGNVIGLVDWERDMEATPEDTI